MTGRVPVFVMSLTLIICIIMQIRIYCKYHINGYNFQASILAKPKL